METEDKAKRYDEALERAKKLYEQGTITESLSYVFPELKESEDEKIRKAIHIYFDWLDGRKDYAPKGKYTIRDMIAWLEKQGEQDPYNGVSFKYNGHTWGMCARDNGVDILLDRQLIKHLEKQGEQKQDPCEHCADKRLNCHNFPCVKKRAFEQGKSALEVINEENVDNANNVEQNPSWSEEDKEILKISVENLTELKDRFGKDYGRVGDCINWLKSIKDRCTWRPSDEQMEAFENFVRGIWESCYDSPYENNTKLLYSLLEDLKKLK